MTDSGTSGGTQAEPTGVDVASVAQELVRDSLDVWVAMAKRWHERARAGEAWQPDHAVGDLTDLIEHLTPIAERGLDLTIQALKPWANAVQARRTS